MSQSALNTFTGVFENAEIQEPSLSVFSIISRDFTSIIATLRDRLLTSDYIQPAITVRNLNKLLYRTFSVKFLIVAQRSRTIAVRRDAVTKRVNVSKRMTFVQTFYTSHILSKKKQKYL